MSDENTCVWEGASGQEYKYWLHDLPTSFKAGQDGNYIYCKIENDAWVPIYIGQGDVGTRISDHHQAQCIARKGATHIHVHTRKSKQARLDEESDLLAAHPEAYAPTGCNQKAGG